MLSVLNIEKFIKTIDKSGNYLFVIMCSTGLVHVLYLFIFYFTGVYAMAYLNCVSVLVYMVVLVIAAKGYYNISGPVAFGEIMIHQILGVYFCGPYAGFHYLLFCLLLAQFGMLAKSKCQFIATALISLVLFAWYFLTSNNIDAYSQLYYQQENYHEIYHILHPLNLALSIMFAVIYGLLASVNSSGKIDDLLNMVYKDFLTGLYNRKFLEERAWSQITRQGCVLVAIADIDNFKKINDTYGHAAGDVVLKYVSTIMQQESLLASRNNISIYVGRWGGEEFVIIANCADCQEACDMLERIRLELCSHKFAGISETVSITIGAVTSRNYQHESLQKYVSIADEMLYNGKKSTKNVVVCKNLE